MRPIPGRRRSARYAAIKPFPPLRRIAFAQAIDGDRHRRSASPQRPKISLTLKLSSEGPSLKYGVNGPALPQELLEYAMGFIQDRWTLHWISLVSQALLVVARRELFRECYVMSHRNGRSLADFVEFVDQCSWCTGLIQSLYLRCKIKPVQFCEVVSKLPALRRISMVMASIDVDHNSLPPLPSTNRELETLVFTFIQSSGITSCIPALYLASLFRSINHLTMEAGPAPRLPPSETARIISQLPFRRTKISAFTFFSSGLTPDVNHVQRLAESLIQILDLRNFTSLMIPVWPIDAYGPSIVFTRSVSRTTRYLTIELNSAGEDLSGDRTWTLLEFSTFSALEEIRFEFVVQDDRAEVWAVAAALLSQFNPTQLIPLVTFATRFPQRYFERIDWTRLQTALNMLDIQKIQFLFGGYPSAELETVRQRIMGKMPGMRHELVVLRD
ncbi:hypothetical protein EIP91_010269 [Steccherinum ochraceum]|uniref:F-box domain-containing protein n=1 Tax=Steccherinum ochraceum TaxID=92696 RepID=A0A4R0RZE2_9APHY|nr:hypothetical protein EIP91_010269 [Steccherinum ochraceum]